ncbi:MAG: hypothetical protein A2896_00565 [Candidatus Nealsonbacteria bacterium RIFCSPLOWO2_01_FULL_43_32]|uniref:Thioredoxin domain-containing protein n=1 Tax=Candidatus Nealsonbacteria bacterium RIFCSPLOWO2_01_FULL_43_32 TaxID=1801672 RepID=A0A1G2EGV5_9BACT|nr:MAG: hypothetical protein A2896_00565 [Candidatus Nealsonbacteria bacterium RIFCSPLOWO2_01_FULL_43_32]
MAKINTSTIIIAMLIVIVVGLLIVNGSKNKINVPAVDERGHPIAANSSAALLENFKNKPAPEFALADKDGKIYSLNELRGKNVILFFNEGLMCYPACWDQIVAFAKDERFNNADTIVLSVVVDPPEEWQKAVEQMPELGEATVIFDKNAAVSKRFGMLTTASSMHYGSLPGHTYVLINKEGIIKHIFDDPNMSIHNNQLVLELEKLSQNQ